MKTPNEKKFLQITNYSDGYVIKHENGVMEQCKIIYANAIIDTAWGNFYFSAIPLGNWFEDFKDTPFVTYQVNSNGIAVWLASQNDVTKSSLGSIALVRPDNRSFPVEIRVTAKGFWK